jgi:serine O-acetyltransferase
MIKDLKADYERYSQVDGDSGAGRFVGMLKVWYFGFGLQVLAVHRFYRWCVEGKNRFSLIYKFPLLVVSFPLKIFVQSMYDIRISGKAKIERGCYIGHFGGINIGPCEIGQYCNINHQVTIGGDGENYSPQEVVIGDKVWVGAHSNIMRGTRIGSGVVVSSGCIVKGEIPDCVLVIGRSARILERNIDNSALLGMEICRSKGEA